MPSVNASAKTVAPEKRVDMASAAAETVPERPLRAAERVEDRLQLDDVLVGRGFLCVDPSVEEVRALLGFADHDTGEERALLPLARLGPSSPRPADLEGGVR